MSPVEQTAAASLALSVGVAAVALLLAWRQWREGRGRESDLSAADSAHFLRQDIRRWMGVVVMILIAVALAVGSRVEPKAAGRTNPWFVVVWLTVCVLVLVLLVLALFDWLGTSRYARRHRQAIARARRELFEEQRRRRSYRGDGDSRPDPTNGPGPFGPPA
jgi:hypothetical protein